MDQRSRAPAAWALLRRHSAVDGLDVESLYRAIEDLRRVATHDSPWRQVVMLPGTVTSRALEDLQFDILDVVVATLRERASVANVSYLHPLVRAQILGIASLNFDTLVERAARECAIPLGTGADLWDGGFHWPTLEGQTPLLKLHGSLDWIQEIRKGGPIPITGRRTLTMSEEYRFGGGGVFSDIRFGLDNKLTQEGAMPALLSAFADLLERSALLVVVGYSFRDQHVDAVLNRWAALDDRRRVIILDPAREPDDFDGLEKSGSAWFAQMVAGMRHDRFPGREHRLCVVPESANGALRTVFAT